MICNYCEFYSNLEVRYSGNFVHLCINLFFRCSICCCSWALSTNIFSGNVFSSVARLNLFSCSRSLALFKISDDCIANFTVNNWPSYPLWTQKLHFHSCKKPPANLIRTSQWCCGEVVLLGLVSCTECLQINKKIR